MRTRAWIVPVCLLMSLTIGACGTDNGRITVAESQSDSGGSLGDSISGQTIPGTDQTIPDLGDLPDIGDLPDLSDLPGGSEHEECTNLGLLYATLSLGAIGSGEDAKKSQQASEELAKLVPADLQDDVEVVASAFAKVQDSIFEAGQAMSSPEFETANKNISDYIGEVCGATPGG